MGASQSSSPPPPLADWTADEVAASVHRLGSRYSIYAEAIRENAVDGSLLLSTTETTLEETLDDLGIVNRLHRRVLKTKLTLLLQPPPNDDDDDGETQDISTTRSSKKRTLVTTTSCRRAAADDGEGLTTTTTTARRPSSFDTAFGPPPVVVSSSPAACAAASEEPLHHNKRTRLHNDNDRAIKRPRRVTAIDPAAAATTSQQSTRCCAPLSATTGASFSHRRSLADEALLMKMLSPPPPPLPPQLSLRAASMSNVGAAIEASPPVIFGCCCDSSMAVGTLTLDLLAQLVPTFFQQPTTIMVDHHSSLVREPLHHHHQAPAPVVVDTTTTTELMSIHPESGIGRRLRGLVEMTARVLDVPIGMLLFHDQFSCCEAGRDGDDNTAVICSSYPVSLTSPKVIADLAAAAASHHHYASSRILYQQTGVRFCVGCQLVDAAGRSVATLCLADTQLRQSFGALERAQLEQSTYILLQELQNWTMRHKMQVLERQRQDLLCQVVHTNKSQPPVAGKAAIVRTDVEGSTHIWELDSAAMQAALDVHARILRETYTKHNGYEIETEGDAFYLAFHDAVDALSFCVDAQLRLHHANWPVQVLELCNREVVSSSSCAAAADDAKSRYSAAAAAAAGPRSFRGLRVRMGVHYGPVDTQTHELTRRVQYTGEAWNVSKGLESMCHGGQILATQETWNLASSLGTVAAAEQSSSAAAVGPCQVLDLGLHVVVAKGEFLDQGVVSKTVLQVVPESLAFDYHANSLCPEPKSSISGVASLGKRCESSEGSDVAARLPNSSTLQGRQFPPLMSRKQLSPSFHDAPTTSDNHVAILFLQAGEAEKRISDFEQTARVQLTRLIGELLVAKSTMAVSNCYRGYHCKEFMVAFSTSSDAMRFAFDYFKALRIQEAKQDDQKLSQLVKFGCVYGTFLSMSPNQRTGRADYFGMVVNRAARVAHAAPPGRIVLGIPLLPQSDASTTVRADAVTSALQQEQLHSDIRPTLLDVRELKGVLGKVALFDCSDASGI